LLLGAVAAGEEREHQEVEPFRPVGALTQPTPA
jgi:hypothetical protein